MGQQCLHVCYDCLCLIALFREVMLLLRDRAEWSFWTGTDSGYCRTITWELGYLGSLNPPCDVDRLCDRKAWQIKELEVVVITAGNDDNRLHRCACVHGLRWGSFPREGFRSLRLDGLAMGAVLGLL